jgi:hypothetical protein
MIKTLRAVLLAGSALYCLSLASCAPPPPPPAPAPPPAQPDPATLAKIKSDAYNAGFIAGKRLEIRRYAAALTAAQAATAAAQTQPPAKPDCAPAPAPPPPPVTHPATTTPAPVYVPLGPAVPLSTGN